jgi:hypothetical protein
MMMMMMMPVLRVHVTVAETAATSMIVAVLGRLLPRGRNWKGNSIVILIAASLLQWRSSSPQHIVIRRLHHHLSLSALVLYLCLRYWL